MTVFFVSCKGEQKSSTVIASFEMSSKDEAAPSIVVLAHELVHSYDIDVGNLDWFYEKRGGVVRSEIHAVEVENLVREYFGIPKRTTYHGTPTPK